MQPVQEFVHIFWRQNKAVHFRISMLTTCNVYNGGMKNILAHLISTNTLI